MNCTNIWFKTDNNIKIQMYITRDRYLYVKCEIIGETYNQIPYKIHKDPLQNKCTQIKDISKEFKIGDYYVEITQDGYKLKDENKNLVYISEIEIEYDKNGAFIAIESEWDRVGLVQQLKEKRTYYNCNKLFGMGESNNNLELKNKSFKMYHTADLGNQELMYIPFYFSKTGHATYINANGNDTIDFIQQDDTNIMTIYSTNQLYFDYYLYHRDTPKDVVSTFYSFAKANSLIPKWVFGYIQSKFGYESEDEIYDLLNKIEHYDVPVSAIVIDLHWYKVMGDLDWNLERFPHYREMYEKLKSKNIKMMTITQPFFAKDSKNYEEFDKNDVFAKRIKETPVPQTMVWGDWWCRDSLYGSVINPIAKSTQKLLGKKYIEMKQKGLDGFWLDLGEPENVPPQTYFNQYTEEEFHQYFSHEWIKILYSEIQKAFPNERLFFLSRCGFTGTARYNVSIWSGDSSATFTNLKNQIMIGVNSGLSGYSYWGSDAGGFLSQLKLPEEELYIRWLQFACFTPVFRTHGKKTPREPWCFGGNTTKLMVDLIKLRNNLIPYIYSSSYQTYKDGIPIMRPMFFENCDDENVWSIDDQYYFGDSLLVAPVVKRLSEEKKKQVYLPKGTWYDFYTLKPIKTKGYNLIDMTLEKIPVYIKEGGIVMMDDKLVITQSSSENHWIWYIDDGETNDYLNGKYEAIKIQLKNNILTFYNVKEEKNINIVYACKDGNIIKVNNFLINKGETSVNL